MKCLNILCGQHSSKSKTGCKSLDAVFPSTCSNRSIFNNFDLTMLSGEMSDWWNEFKKTLVVFDEQRSVEKCSNVICAHYRQGTKTGCTVWNIIFVQNCFAGKLFDQCDGILSGNKKIIGWWLEFKRRYQDILIQGRNFTK